MKSSRWPIWLTALVAAASAAYFFASLDYTGICAILLQYELLLPLLVLIAIVAQWLKSMRMFVIMMDTQLSYRQNLSLYAVTTAINIMTPFKIGELYRIALYGRYVGSYIGGAVRVVFDRAIDTAALLTYLTILILFQTSAILPLYLILLALFVLFCVAWFVFPQLYRFWNDYLISQRHSRRSVKLLSALSDLNTAYEFLRSILRGRTFIVYLFSMLAWGLELVGVYALTLFAKSGSIAQISAYLTSTLSTTVNEYQKLFALCYLVVLSILFLYSVLRQKRS
jgi:uncharacterized protein (TIRG00374 family)